MNLGDWTAHGGHAETGLHSARGNFEHAVTSLIDESTRNPSAG
jgi:hypothetical protein